MIAITISCLILFPLIPCLSSFSSRQQVSHSAAVCTMQPHNAAAPQRKYGGKLFSYTSSRLMAGIKVIISSAMMNMQISGIAFFEISITGICVMELATKRLTPMGGVT